MTEATPTRLTLDERTHPGVALTMATLSVAVSALPIFLLGALAVFVREDLRFSESALGLAVSSYYLTSAVASVPGGRFSERLGGRRAIAVAASITLLSLLGVATLATSWGTLVPIMMLAGIANGITMPASNLLLARSVPVRHQGIAFGLKQSSGPMATIVAGAAVPIIGLTIGWRWAFVIVAAIAAPLLLLGRSAGGAAAAPERERLPRELNTPLVVLGIGAATAVFGTSSLGAFYVESAVVNGISAGPAGTMLAVGAATGIGARILWGAVGGRSRRSHIPLLATLLVGGSIGYVLLGGVSSELSLAMITVFVFATAWGWPALLLYAIVVRSEPAPAAATGVTAAGLYAGGIVGPVVFGALVEGSGYEAAWAFLASANVVAGALIYVGGRRLDRAHRLVADGSDLVDTR